MVARGRIELPTRGFSERLAEEPVFIVQKVIVAFTAQAVQLFIAMYG